MFFLDDDGFQKPNETTTSLLGVVLVVFALIADGVYAGAQASLVTRQSEYVLMGRMNFWQAALAIALSSGEFHGAIYQLLDEGSFGLLRDLVTFTVSKALGTLCVYRLLRESGTLVVSTVTTTRKVLTVTLSVVAFGHHLSMIQYIALILVFFHSKFGDAMGRLVLRREKSS